MIKRGSYYERSKGMNIDNDPNNLHHHRVVHQKDTEAQIRLRKETRARKKRFEARERALKLKEEKRRVAILEERKKKVSAHRNDIELAKGHKYHHYSTTGGKGNTSRRSSFSTYSNYTTSTNSRPKQHIQHSNTMSSNINSIPSSHHVISERSPHNNQKHKEEEVIDIINSNFNHRNADKKEKNKKSNHKLKVAMTKEDNSIIPNKPHDELFQALDESLDEFITQYYENTDNTNNTKKSETVFSRSPTVSSSSSSSLSIEFIHNNKEMRKNETKKDPTTTTILQSKNTKTKLNSKLKNLSDVSKEKENDDDIDNILSALEPNRTKISSSSMIPRFKTSSLSNINTTAEYSTTTSSSSHRNNSNQKPPLAPLAPLKDSNKRILRRSSRSTSRNSIISNCSVFGCEEKAESRRYCAHHLQTCFPPALSNSSITSAATTVSRSPTTRSAFSIASLPPLNKRQSVNDMDINRRKKSHYHHRRRRPHGVNSNVSNNNSDHHDQKEKKNNKDSYKYDNNDKPKRHVSAPIIRGRDASSSKGSIYNDYPNRGYVPRARARNLRIQQRNMNDVNNFSSNVNSNVNSVLSNDNDDDDDSDMLTVPDIRLDESFEEEKLRQSIDRLENRLQTLIKRSTNRQKRLNIIEQMKHAIPAPPLPSQFSNDSITRKTTGITNKTTSIETSHEEFPPFVFS